MKSKFILGLFGLGVAAFGFAALSANQVSADDHKVTICHATNSHKNPYTTNTVSKSSIDEPNNSNKYLNGHGDHLGPVWFSGIPDHSWGDIIPPFKYTKSNGTTIEFKGYNWVNNSEGQAWYKNNCQKPGTTPIDFCSTSSVKGDVAGWLKDNGINGADCFDYLVNQQCGSLDVKITKQPQPQYSQGPFRAVYVIGDKVTTGYKNLPVSFPEDYNGGSVEVTWFTVGPEGDWLLGTNFPNFWSKVGERFVIDTDCKNDTPAVAKISAEAKCAVYQNKAKIELTITNSSAVSGDVKVNGETVNVPANDSVTKYFDSKTNVQVTNNGKTILDQTLDCTPGQGGITTPETPKVPELPNTAGASTQVIAISALSLAGLVLLAGAAIKSRLLA